MKLVVAILLVLVASASASAADLPGFRSPSRNISCLFVPGPATILCKLDHADYAHALQSRCLGSSGGGVDWHGFSLTAAQKGMVLCSGGILYNPTTQHPRYITLAYGTTWHHKMFGCTSKVAGVTCSNHHGHGLFISRQTWRTW